MDRASASYDRSMYRGIGFTVLALLATNLNACQRDRHFHHDGVNLKRQVTERLPLSDAEMVITSSFDNRSISDWSYYYVGGYCGFASDED